MPFRVGHKGYRYWLGKKRSEETKLKISKAKKGRTVISPETRKKISEKLKGRMPKNLSLLHSPEVIKKAAKTRIGHPNYLKGQTLEARKKISEHNARFWKGKRMPIEVRQKMSKAQKGKTLSKTTRKKISEAYKRRWEDPVYRAKMSVMVKAKWQDPEYVGKVTEKRVVACLLKPNKKEIELIKLFREHSLPFKYVGDGKLVIDRFIPDFSDGNGKLIELYGNYWHRNDNPQERIDFFRERGYDCLVIWESELESKDDLLEKINEFVEKT